MAYGAMIKNKTSTQYIGSNEGIPAMLNTIEYYLTHNTKVGYIIITNTETEFKVEIKGD